MIKSGPLDTTMGKLIPLGAERLKICELFAEVLHLQYLFTSSPLFDFLVQENMTDEQGDKVLTVADGIMTLCALFVEKRFAVESIVFQKLTQNLFFNFPWNNFLHSVVYDMIAKTLNTFTYTSTVLSDEISSTDVSQSAEKLAQMQSMASPKMKAFRLNVRKLVVSFFKDAHLTALIVNAQRLNDYEVELPKGVRLGYMGHLTYISDELCKLLDKCADELDDELHGIF
jgi:hypothetical protein